MLREIVYINHMNEKIEFGKNGIIMSESDLLDYSWSIISKNDKISSFKKGITSKTISVIIKCNSESEGMRQRNRLFETLEKDVLANKHGKLIIGEYYLRCFVIESKKARYIRASSYIEITLKISTDLPYWIKERKTTFNYESNDSAGSNLDYNRDFPSDYTSNLLGTTLNNMDFVDSNFVINIYGACENPMITIGGHIYEVSASIGVNEYLTIDSVNKTIILTHNDGAKENCFNLRNRDSYIFEKIPVGISQVSSSTGFKFDVVLLEERSEPKWT